MCTLSWFTDKSGYQLFFNRDEQRSRSLALPPQWNPDGNAIYPLDPVGKGSWIALTANGAAFCLLNNYQAATSYPGTVSRGQIIMRLLAEAEPLNAIYQYDLSVFSPFILCHFPATLSSNAGNVSRFSWDGVTLHHTQANSPQLSSALTLAMVSQQRHAAFSNTKETAASYLQVHRSHQGEPSALSVCMHRPDAHTVSLSHIKVNQQRCQFDYYAGSPCSATAPLSLSFAR